MSAYYFLMCQLPPTPAELGAKMPLSFGETAAMIKRNAHPEHLEIVDARLQAIDVFNWEQASQGRDVFLEGGTLSREEVYGNKNLPPFISVFREEKERGLNRYYAYDRLWELYFAYALAVAERNDCRFLIDYLSWEIELRMALTAWRVKESSGSLEDHAILKHLCSRDFSNLIAQVKSSVNPLELERYLDEERLRQVFKYEGISGFSIDALLGYLTRAEIYHRWQRISETLNLNIDTFLLPGESK